MQLDEMPVTSPYQRHGNWENADGLRFFCQWVDTCPPCEDTSVCAAPCFVTLTETTTNMTLTISATLIMISVCLFVFSTYSCVSMHI